MRASPPRWGMASTMRSISRTRSRSAASSTIGAKASRHTGSTRLGTPGAMFGLPETRRGLVGVGATARAALRLPPAVAMELALTGEPIDAARAHVLGLVNRVTDRARLLSDAIEVAERIAANGPLAVAAAKRIVSEVARLQDGAPIAGMRPRFEHVRRSEDAREGAAAFLERRPPRFSGR